MTLTSPPQLLRIDASARTEGSISRQVADEVQAQWQARLPAGRVVRRDLATESLPHISNETIQGFYTPPDAMTDALRHATARSDGMIAELKSAHTVLIATPVYNFSAPSALKAWIDQIVRIGQTFAYDGSQFTGLVTGPKAILVLAYGAAGYDGPLSSMDHLRPYLTSLLRFLGFNDIQVIAVQGTTADADTVGQHVRQAKHEAAQLFAA